MIDLFFNMNFFFFSQKETTIYSNNFLKLNPLPQRNPISKTKEEEQAQLGREDSSPKRDQREELERRQKLVSIERNFFLFFSRESKKKKQRNENRFFPISSLDRMKNNPYQKQIEAAKEAKR